MISSQKVKEGKLIKVEVEFDGTVRRIKITGDFFLHPEDILEQIENSMVGMEKEVSEKEIASKIRDITEAYKAQMIGFSEESLAQVIKEALR